MNDKIGSVEATTADPVVWRHPFQLIRQRIDVLEAIDKARYQTILNNSPDVIKPDDQADEPVIVG